MPMKVLFVGNQGNTGYRFVRWLVEYGVDATLLLPHNFNHPRSYPEWEDPGVKGNYPRWIKTFSEKRYPFLWLNRTIKKEASQCDVVLTTGFYILPVLTLPKPVIFLPAGSDLTRMPFWSGNPAEALHAYLYRRRIRKVAGILTDQEDCVWAARLLGVGSRLYRFPFLTDVRSIEKNIHAELKKNLKEKYKHYDCIFFSPARKNMDPERPDYKGPEKLLEAYRRFLYTHPDAHVLMVAGMHGLHADAFKKRAEEMGLDEKMEYTGHLSLPELHAWFSLPNLAVFDQFTVNLNALSGIQREALALGRPVVSSTDVHTDAFRQAYGPDCPLLPAFDASEIFRAMEHLPGSCSDPAATAETAARKWALKYLHYESRIQELITILESTHQQHTSRS